ncbi:UbiX family flavin prenyltransferase [Microaerobacter geothermalis]|uniref:UbiX family flavin prenyltransferase n=1 Tax=Microaerobacter geothermalis TaxID=674972 RepID=UPI001F1FF1FA|nr:UbiX family flavin prenyltransferase [Microaerobacter geothermalis]MCF6095339.1 UbiX family flavin prenyltransferase [Microaerobacter geothermalis]
MTTHSLIYTVGITGASGAIYGVCLTQELLKLGCTVHLIITEAGWQVFKEELNWDNSDREMILKENIQKDFPGILKYHHLRDFTAPIASGSYKSKGMIIIPCSMGTLSGIANGASGNLLERTADVMIKEGRTLLLVPRETPLNAIQLENMLKLSRIGVRIVPAMPGFYHRPQSLDDLVRFMVGKVLDNLGLDHHLFRRWGD